MKKKLLTVALAATMVLSSALSAFAADTSVEATGWWVDHSEGYEVTADGVTVTFNTTTDDSATANWNTPLYVLYGADAKFEGGAGISDVAGYAEYFVMRSDLFGWSGAAQTTEGYVGDTNAGTAYATAIVKEGAPADEAAWATWLETNKAGTTGTLSAKLDGSNAVVTIEVAGVKSTATIPVDTSKTMYVSLGGELCTITNIAVASNEAAAPEGDTTAAPEGDTTAAGEGTTTAAGTTAGTTTTPNTGDATMVGLLLAVAAVSAVVVLKKRTVAE